MSLDTEQKIKNAAQKIFKQKGYAAARTRDIAEEAGVNLALLNYYYKSKEQLFNVIMFETIETFKKTIIEFLNDDSVDFTSNLQRLINSYTSLFLEEPELPLFIVSELQKHQNKVVERINPRGMITGSVFEKQMREILSDSSVDSSQIFINIMAITLFPFIGKSIVQNICGIDDNGFRELVEQRRKMIPMWATSIIKTTSK